MFRRLLLTCLFLILASLPSSSQYICCLLGPALTGTAIGSGLNFQSKTTALYAAPNSALQFTAPFTIAVRIQTNALSSTANVPLLDTTAGGNTGIWIYDYSGNTSDPGLPVLAAVNPAAGNGSCANASVVCARLSAINDGQAHDIVYTYDGTTATLQIDAGQTWKDTNAVGGTFTPGTNYWDFGQAGLNATFFDLTAWNRVLSTNETSLLSRTHAAGFIPNSGSLTNSIVGHWLLNNCTTSCPDSSGNNNPLIFDTTAPSVAVTAPSNGGTITGSSVTLTATCSDNIICLSVQLQVDGFNVGAAIASSPYTTTFDSTLLKDGAHTISAIGTDPAGNSATASISVTSSNGITGIAYYFDSVGGSDSNNCTSTGTACQTMAKAQSVANAGLHAADTMNFLIADTWSVMSGTNSAALLLAGANPGTGFTQNVFAWPSNGITVQNYGGSCSAIAGTGPCPLIDISGGSLLYGVKLVNLDGATIQGMAAFGGATQQVFTSGGPCCSGFAYAVTNGKHYGLTIQNTDSHDIGNGVFVNGGFASQGQGLLGFTINNNLARGTATTTNTDQGIYVIGSGASNGLIQGNLDYNIGGHASPAFLGEDGNGILIANSVTTVTDQFNVTRDIGANHTQCGGPVGNWGYASSFVIFKFDESYRIRPTSFTTGCDWDSYDLDGGMQNSILTWSYSHDSFGSAVGTYQGVASNNHAWFSNQISFSLSENDAASLEACIFVSNIPNITSKSAIYNITCYNAGSGSSIANGILLTADMDMLISNNILFNGNNNTLLQANGSYTHYALNGNNYWRSSAVNPRFRWNGSSYNTVAQFNAATGYEATQLSFDPSFSSGGTGGTCYPGGSAIPAGPQNQPPGCPAGYALNGGSPAIGTGINLASALTALGFTVPTRDYYANFVPNADPGTGWNLGAYNGP